MKTNKLTRWELFAVSIGSVVGAGVVTATGLAVGQTGRSAWIAYGLAVLLGCLLAIPIFFNTSTIITDGGLYTFTRLYCGPALAGSSAVAGVLNFFGQGMMSLALASYIVSLIPALPMRPTAAVILTLLFLVNLRGNKFMAKVQGPMTIALFIGLGLFIIVGMFNLQSNPFSFSSPDFFMNGSEGLFAGCMLLCFSTKGVISAVFYNRQSANPKKDTPIVMILTALGIFILYVGVAMVDGNVLPVADVAGKPLTDVAFEIMPSALAVAFVIFGPIMALLTTINGGWASFYRPLSAAARDGILPAGLAKTNKYDIPFIILIAQYVVGMFPIVSGLSVSELMNSLVLTASLLDLSCYIGCFRMPKVFPEAWKKSKMHVPDGVYYFLCCFTIIADLFIMWQSIKNLSLGLVILNFAVLIIAVAYCMFRVKKGKVTASSVTYTEYDHWEDDPKFKEDK